MTICRIVKAAFWQLQKRMLRCSKEQSVVIRVNKTALQNGKGVCTKRITDHPVLRESPGALEIPHMRRIFLSLRRLYYRQHEASLVLQECYHGYTSCLRCFCSGRLRLGATSAPVLLHRRIV